MRYFLLIAIAVTTVGCAGMNSIETVAPKFTGRSVELMASYFGPPDKVSEAGTLTFYEWRRGQYATEPTEVDGHVSDGGTVNARVSGGETKFLGCIVQAMVDDTGTVKRVTLDSRTGNVGYTYEFVGCGEMVNDPFEMMEASLNELEQSMSFAFGTKAEQITEVMGDPVQKFTIHDMDEWHYCANGINADKFVTLYFDGGALIQRGTYYVTIEDTAGETGDCSKFVRQGSYELPVEIAQRRTDT
jgi:hypothetical protein